MVVKVRLKFRCQFRFVCSFNQSSPEGKGWRTDQQCSGMKRSSNHPISQCQVGQWVHFLLFFLFNTILWCTPVITVCFLQKLHIYIYAGISEGNIGVGVSYGQCIFKGATCSILVSTQGLKDGHFPHPMRGSKGWGGLHSHVYNSCWSLYCSIHKVHRCV